MTTPDCYFHGLISRQRLLRKHGLSRSLDVDELTDLVLSLSDEVDALYSAFGLRAYVDHRGRVSAIGKNAKTDSDADE